MFLDHLVSRYNSDVSSAAVSVACDACVLYEVLLQGLNNHPLVTLKVHPSPVQICTTWPMHDAAVHSLVTSPCSSPCWGGCHAAVVEASNQSAETHQLVELCQSVKAAGFIRENDHMAFQQRDGNVPGIEALAQELNKFRGDFGLRLTEADAFQKRLQQAAQCSKEKAAIHTALPAQRQQNHWQHGINIAAGE